MTAKQPNTSHNIKINGKTLEVSVEQQSDNRQVPTNNDDSQKKSKKRKSLSKKKKRRRRVKPQKSDDNQHRHQDENSEAPPATRDREHSITCDFQSITIQNRRRELSSEPSNELLELTERLE
jgi:hypothetical protein